MEWNGNVVTRVCGIWHVGFETKPRCKKKRFLKMSYQYHLPFLQENTMYFQNTYKVVYYQLHS